MASSVTATFLFCDLVGSTALLTRIGDDAGDDVRRRCFGVFRESVVAHRGTEVKNLGDGILAQFPNSVGDAIGCGIAMQRGMARLDRESPLLGLGLRVGVAVGEAANEDGDWFGKPVVEASRLCGAATKDQILVADLARQLVGSRGGYQFTSLGSMTLKGLDPIMVFEVAWASEDGGGFVPLPTALEGRGQMPFVGRQRERQTLDAAWRRAQDGRRGTVAVIGEQWVGKSRLVAEWAGAVHEAGATLLYGRCRLDSAEPYEPFTEALGWYVASAPDDVLRSEIGPLGGELVRIVPSLLNRIVDLPGPEGDSSGSRRRLFDAVDGLLTAAARSSPTVVALDDLHLAQPPTVALLRHLVEQPSGARLLIVAMATQVPGQVPPLTELRARQEVEVISLDGLGSDDVELLVATVTGRPATEIADAAAGMRSETDGNPGLIGQLLEGAEARGGPAASLPCPYKGLAAFQPDDHEIFFGREEIVATLLARLGKAPLLGVVGASGSGKSSLVRAGLLPALWRGALPGSAGWRTVVMAPGAHPLAELSAQLALVMQASAAGLLRDLEADRRTLDLTARQLLTGANPSARLLLVVDQFEELFTICEEPAERERFLDAMLYAVGAPGARTSAVVVLRADFYGAAASVPALAAALESNHVLLGPMREDELRAAVERPARHVGLRLEPGLVEAAVADVTDQAGALPLLSHALLETWRRRNGRTLTVDAYRVVGGARGAIARTADTVIGNMDPQERAIAKRIFLRLVEVGDGTEDTSRRAHRSEIDPDHDPAVHRVLQQLIDARLLTTGESTVEITHEALIRGWPELRDWLDEDREGLRLLSRLRNAAREWEILDHDPGELQRGARLSATLDWVDVSHPALDAAERRYLDASRAAEEAELDAARDRARRDARSKRRLRVLLGGVAILLVLALAAGLLFLGQRNEAQHATRVTRVRELAGGSTLALDVDPELSILLALEAVDVSRSAGEPVQPEAIAALHEAVQASRLEVRMPTEAELVDASHDGDLLATASSGGPVVIWDAHAGEQLRSLIGPVDPATNDSDSVAGLAFDPETTVVAASYASADQAAGELRPAIILWDGATGVEAARLIGRAGAYSSPTFSSDGRSVAALGIREGGAPWVTVWDVASGAEHVSFEPAGEALSVAFHPDGESLYVAEFTAERVGFYSIDNGREIGFLATPGFEPTRVDVDSAGRRVAVTAELDGVVQVWNLENQQLLRTISAVGIWVVDWSPDGERFAMSNGNQGPVQVVDVESGQVVMVLRGHVTARDVAFVGKGDRLVSVGGEKGDLRVWNVSRNGPPALGAITALVDGPFGFELSSDGAEVAMLTGRQGGAVEFVSADTGELVRPTLTDRVLLLGVSISPDWRLVASVRSDGLGEIHDLRSLAPVAALPPCTSPSGFSPDASLLVLDGRSMCTPTEGAQLFDPPPDADLRSRVIDVGTGEEILDLGARVINTSVFNPEGRLPAGRYLAVALPAEELVEIYDVVARELLTTVPAPALLGLDLDPTGQWLVGRGFDGTVWVLDLAAVVEGVDPEEVLVFNQIVSKGSARAVANGDGILATSGSGDGLLRLWNFQSGELLLEFRTDRVEGPTVGNGWMRFSPDGSYMLYMDAAGVLRRYLLDTDELIALAETRLTRDFTVDECRRYLAATECP